MGHARLSRPSNRVAQAQTSPTVRPCQIRNPARPPATRKTPQGENESHDSQAPAATTRLPSRALSWGLHHVVTILAVFFVDDAGASVSSDGVVVNGGARRRTGDETKRDLRHY